MRTRGIACKFSCLGIFSAINCGISRVARCEILLIVAVCIARKFARLKIFTIASSKIAVIFAAKCAMRIGAVAMGTNFCRSDSPQH